MQITTQAPRRGCEKGSSICVFVNLEPQMSGQTCRVKYEQTIIRQSPNHIINSGCAGSTWKNRSQQKGPTMNNSNPKISNLHLNQCLCVQTKSRTMDWNGDGRSVVITGQPQTRRMERVLLQRNELGRILNINQKLLKFTRFQAKLN